MARPQCKLGMGYVPLPEVEARRIRGHLSYPTGGIAALDPCADDGRAFELITENANGHRYGIELDAHRAAQARERIGPVIYGDCFDVECHTESFPLLYLNPPYDVMASDEGPSERLEALFLQHTYRWLKPGGVLILVIPVVQLSVCGNRLSVQFTNAEVYRLTDPQSAQYQQVVLLGVRRTRREREQLSDWEITQARLEYGRKARDYESLAVLTDQPGHVYSVPEAGPVELIHRGLPLDVIEDQLQKSAAYRQARRILFAQEIRAAGRQLTPLHQGHVVLPATSGRLDGIFGQDELRHVARWQGIKTILRVEEEDDRGVTTIREKEQFSHCLNLLFVDGRTAVLTADESPKDESVSEHTNAPEQQQEGLNRNGKCRVEGSRMENAHERFGWLEFTRTLKDTTVRIRLRLDRMIGEVTGYGCEGKFHLLSVIGRDSDVGAVWAAVQQNQVFNVTGAGMGGALELSLGEKAECFRGSISVPGLKRPVRHLVAVSAELASTRLGAATVGTRTILCDADPVFVLCRLSERFGLPVLPDWANWFCTELRRQKAITPLAGIGCSPVLLSGTKDKSLSWISRGLRRKAIKFPENNGPIRWPQIKARKTEPFAKSQ